MRIRDNKVPASVTVENYDPIPEYAEVRLRENVRALSDGVYEYDEYILHVRDKDDLQQEIENNLADWLTTGRTLEFNQSASAVEDMREALAILGVNE